VIGKVHRLGIAGRDAPARPHNVGGRPSTRIRASAGGVRRTPSQTPRPPRMATPAQPRVIFEVAATATIHSLTEHACRWPIGEPDQDGFGFCGRLRTGHGAYCAGHAPMAVRRRDTPMKSKEIERIVTRFVEGARYEPVGAELQLREIA
jgi:GcrA cell cycle regulator